MPVARYFLFVGGVLLVLLFAFDSLAPKQVAVASNAADSSNKTMVRIRSDQKPPERVVYDTSLPTIVPPAPGTQLAAVPAAPAADAQVRVRNTFAQYVPAETRKPEKPVEPQILRKRKVVKARANPPVRLAQQSHFGFFGNSSW